tara:strand:- start:90 stop:761 length:672 start_codon:yes stop_codon:yes gene_type:complete
MPETTKFTAEIRNHSSRGELRQARLTGRVPGIVYGGEDHPVMVSVSLADLRQAISSGGFTNRLYDLEVAGKRHRVLPREVQLDPVSEIPLHVDFLRLGADAEVTILVPTTFINEDDCPGLKSGGVINIVRHQIEVRCRADSIPEVITVDLEGIEIGDSIRVSQISLPDDVAPTITDRDFTIATIAAPTIVEEVEEEPDEDEEGELIEGEDSAETGEETEPSEE